MKEMTIDPAMKNNNKLLIPTFVVTKLEDITCKVIPFFDKAPIKGVKTLDYEEFKKVAVLLTKKHHLTEKGINEIKLIKSNMNFQRGSV